MLGTKYVGVMDMVKKFLDEKRALSGRYGSAAQSTTDTVAMIHETQVAAQTLALGDLPAQPKREAEEQAWDVSQTFNPLMLVRRRLSKTDTVASYRVIEPSPLREDVPVWCRDMTNSGKAPPARATAPPKPVAPTAATAAPTAAAVPIPPTVALLPTGPPLPLSGNPPTMPPFPTSPQGSLPSTPSGMAPMPAGPAGGLPIKRPAQAPSTPIPVPPTGHTKRPTTPDVPVNPSDIPSLPMSRGIVPPGRGMSPISVPAPGYNPAAVAPPTGGPPKAPRVVLRIPALGRSTPLVPNAQPTTGVPVGGAPGIMHTNPHGGAHIPINIPKHPVEMAPNPMPPGARPVAVPSGPGVLRMPPSGPVPPQRGLPPHPLARPPPQFQPKVRVLSPSAPPPTGIPTGPLGMPKGPGVAAPPSGNLVVRFNPGVQAAGLQTAGVPQPPKASVLGTLVNYCMKKFPTQVMHVRDIATKKEVPERQRIDMLRNLIQQLEPNAPILTMFMQAKK